VSGIEESIEVGVPVRTAYNQWTQFEDFPRFMEGVTEIRRLDDTTTHWRARGSETGGWRGEVTQDPAG
jgi:uncharacterized membrane protein